MVDELAVSIANYSFWCYFKDNAISIAHLREVLGYLRVTNSVLFRIHTESTVIAARRLHIGLSETVRHEHHEQLVHLERPKLTANLKQTG